ncbi:hypothetical protein XENOCAPTIV_005158 [Xenoophorus captivus]|uniref:Metalloendopeptidase n=1 Tax=Xenoophorus captivus TaxID=1517983 RepID=A0ABV0QGL6_9TELE
MCCSCYSYVGRQGGGQTVSLSRQGCLYHGTVQHELLHALGFNHEQTRSDRDNHIKVHWNNIIEGMEYNFYKIDTLNQGTPYDYNSVMQYESSYNVKLMFRQLPTQLELLMLLYMTLLCVGLIKVWRCSKLKCTPTTTPYYKVNMPHCYKLTAFPLWNMPLFRYAFSKNNLPTMEPIPNSNVSFGQATQMSQNDIARLNRLYKCCKCHEGK